MATSRLLLDTNVFIGLEDGREVAPDFAELMALCQKHGIPIYVHEEAKRDLARDTNRERRKISLSKLAKFQLLRSKKGVRLADLTELFGNAPKPNDEVDIALLHSVWTNAVDFLITQDQGIHARSRRPEVQLDKRVLNVADAVLWVRSAYEPQEVRLPLIEEVLAHEIPSNDPIFDSLRDGYPGFDNWWLNKCVKKHRECWIATVNGELAGLVVRKQETRAEAQTVGNGPNILKICTFKVKPEFRGEKLGEQFLKQIIWYAQRNRYDLVYLTTFSEQDVLIRVLTYFGFDKTTTLENGELVFEKGLSREALVIPEDQDLFPTIRRNYPRFVGSEAVRRFCVPIQGIYHDILFPEISDQLQGDLFGGLLGVTPTRIPGNTIRKVYLCRSKTLGLQPGSLLLFYRSKSKNARWSQHLTSLGVVEAVREAHDLQELTAAAGKRSVYSRAQLREMVQARSSPVRVIDFLLIGHLDAPIPLQELVSRGVFVGHPPQSICELSPARFNPLKGAFNFGFPLEAPSNSPS